MGPCKIVIEGQTARLEADSYIQQAVFEHFSILDAEKQKIYAMKKLPYDPVRHFVTKPPRCCFQAGLTSAVASVVGQLGESVEIEDLVEVPDLRESPGILKLKFQLWDEQRALIEAFKPVRMGTWHAATNSGKTECFGVLCHEMGLVTAFLVNRIGLLHQTAKRFEEMLGEPVGMIGDSRCSIERVTITTVQTLDRALLGKGDNAKEIRGWWTREVELLCADEGHNCTSSSYKRTLSRCAATRRLMMSGTARTGHPIRDLELESLFGPVIGTIKNQEQVEKGRSSKMHVLCVPVREPVLHDLESSEIKEKLVYRNKSRNKIIGNACVAARDLGLPVIVATESKKIHVSCLLKVMAAMGLNVDKVSGDESAERQESSLERLVQGKIDVAVATTVVNEGRNVPAVGMFVDAGASKSTIRLLQQAGRVLRKKENNVSFFVSPIDFTHSKLEKISLRKMEMLEAEDCFEFHIVPVEELYSTMKKILETGNSNDGRTSTA